MNCLASHRLAHYVLLLAVLAGLTLPNLGATALWDMDEGVNAECTREMMETGTWIVPTFNYELRTAKPIMIYWLQRASFNLFGVSEWAARFPSVMASLGTVLLTYELGRRMFSPITGLLAGIALASCFETAVLAHAATPDATFIFFTTLTLAAFWFGQLRGRAWIVPSAVAAGLATLTKGPAGLALPGLVILLFLAWNRELRRLVDRRLILGIIAFLLVAAPWYGLVAGETRGAYIRAFIGNENVNRFLAPMENHRGPVFYYLGALLAFFAPWSIVIGVTLWFGIRSSRNSLDAEIPEATRAHRFLIVWFFSYLAFFSFAATKLPNYIAPLYPALALMTASFLVRWANGSLALPGWVMNLAAAALALTGSLVILGVLITAGTIPLAAKGLRLFPELAPWAALGLIPLGGSLAMFAFLRRGQRDRAVESLAVAAVAFVGLMAAFPAGIVDAAKAPKSLVEQSGAKQLDRDIRLASFDYVQESITFYAERRVAVLFSQDAALAFLAMPRPSYLFVPVSMWEQHLAPLAGPHRIAARHFDYSINEDVLVVTNDGVLP